MANVQSDVQGLQNLLQSIAPEAVQDVTPEALQRLSEKLSELMGEDVARTAFSGADQGVPLVDITEPGSSKSSKKEVSLEEEPPLIPLSSLSPFERANHRRERDRILDLLEQEEEQGQRKADEAERLERQASLEKRREAAKPELDKMKTMKETHKKMGKALMRSMAEARENVEAKPKKEQEDALVHQQVAGTASSQKKTVSFADEDASAPHSTSPPNDWGDLSKGKLRPSPLPNLTGNDSELLMKKNVVERIPGSGQITGQLETKEREADSELPPESDSDQGDHPDTDQYLEVDDLDLDFAFHQREIALAYQEKRGKIGEEAAFALTSLNHEPDEELSSGNSKAKISASESRANRLASASLTSAPSSSQSLGTSVIPVAGADTLKRVIRMGDIDEGGRLVGSEHESEDEDHATMNEQEQEAVQEVVELLKKGQVYNMGPGGDLHTVPPGKVKTAPFTMPTEPPPSVVKQKEKTPSKFKLAKSQNRASTSSSNEVSGSNTPLSTAERSSPKLPGVTELVVPSSSFLKGTMVEAPPFFSNAGSKVIESPSISFPATRLQRPPAVMAAAVKEKEATKAGDGTGDAQPPPPLSDRPPKRISRFKAERM
ncbi:hypothetical protein E1B28_009059 [Marasmius oreades]|uniref:DUF3835 domain-containing protein n=1 Tax=Marasmius oreades TaxID=181124 RepID=A0A9P7RZU3_9AGAR|nr:uncharacterized protein E1B28_009059 [Marasmius oreades]KAG7092730.1 hypothetical protein E1B28_009059 [Marasmius oreades]